MAFLPCAVEWLYCQNMMQMASNALEPNLRTLLRGATCHPVHIFFGVKRRGNARLNKLQKSRNFWLPGYGVWHGHEGYGRGGKRSKYGRINKPIRSPSAEGSLVFINLADYALAIAIGRAGRALLHASELTLGSALPSASMPAQRVATVPKYWIISFKSTAGVTRDLFDLFDISTGPPTERDPGKKFEIEWKRWYSIKQEPRYILRILGSNSH
ncbi:hypothetical protein K438DRAFT_2110826 [Mycena galopus ATCC 62051]|nr:hypothetical protein K438DRAFT_2110826 [Mycena galopus ATCC 62051]